MNARGEVVAPTCKLKPAVRIDELPMAVSPEDVTCRRCRASDRFKALLSEHEERERHRRAAREERAILELIERHREEFDELLTGEAILDVFTDRD